MNEYEETLKNIKILILNYSKNKFFLKKKKLNYHSEKKKEIISKLKLSSFFLKWKNIYNKNLENKNFEVEE